MDQAKFNALYKKLQLTKRIWQARDSDCFYFMKDQSGWSWNVVENSDGFQKKVKALGLQQKGFVSRLAAVRYVDSAFESDLEACGFCLPKTRIYGIEGYDFKIYAIDKNQWMVFDTNGHKGVLQSKGKGVFSSRKEALECFVANQAA